MTTGFWSKNTTRTLSMKVLDLNNLVLRQLTILEAVTERFVTIAVAKK